MELIEIIVYFSNESNEKFESLLRERDSPDVTNCFYTRSNGLLFNIKFYKDNKFYYAKLKSRGNSPVILDKLESIKSSIMDFRKFICWTYINKPTVLYYYIKAKNNDNTIVDMRDSLVMHDDFKLHDIVGRTVYHDSDSFEEISLPTNCLYHNKCKSISCNLMTKKDIWLVDVTISIDPKRNKLILCYNEKDKIQIDLVKQYLIKEIIEVLESY